MQRSASISDSQLGDFAFAALAQTSPDAIITIDQDRRIVSANPAAERMFGYSVHDLTGQSLTVIIPERLRVAHEAGFARYLATGKQTIPWAGVRLSALTKDAREIPVEIAFGAFTDANGNRFFSGFIRDASERVRHEHELEAARLAAEAGMRERAMLARVTDVALAHAAHDDMLSELLHRLRAELRSDAATMLLVSHDAKALIAVASVGLDSEANAGVWVPITRGKAGQVATCSRPVVVDDVGAEDGTEPALTANIRSLAAVPVRSGKDVIGVLQAASLMRGHFGPAEVRVLELVAERMSGALAQMRRFRVERSARKAERALRDLAQAIASASDRRQMLDHVALGALQLSRGSGVYIEQVVNDEANVEIIAAAGDQTPRLGQQAGPGSSFTADLALAENPGFLIRQSGVGPAMPSYLAAQFPDCMALVVPLLAANRVVGAVVVLRPNDDPPFERPVVDRAQTVGDLASVGLQRLAALEEREHRRAEAEAALRSRDDVLSVVSHDLRNPLNTIMMSTTLLQDPQITMHPDEMQHVLGIISRSAHRMNRLIQDLLDVGRIATDRFTVNCRSEDPAAIVREVCEEFRPVVEQHEQTLTYRIAPNPPLVQADRDRVMQLLSNYLNNAVKFTPKGGHIDVELSAQGDGVRFAVADSGPGIQPNDLGRIFDGFWQAKQTAHLGAGLGLAIARGVAAAHGGRVWADSEVGKGSTFYFALPLTPVKRASPPATGGRMQASTSIGDSV